MRLEHGGDASAHGEPAGKPGLRAVQVDEVRRRRSQDAGEAAALGDKAAVGLPSRWPAVHLDACRVDHVREPSRLRARDVDPPAGRHLTTGVVADPARDTRIGRLRDV